MDSSRHKILVPKVAIALDQDQVESFLQNHPLSENQRNLFLDLSCGSATIHERLYSAGLEKIGVEDRPLFDRSSFIKSYVALLGKLGIKNNTREWWATSVASKSRFASNLDELLVQYIKCATAIRNERYDVLLIISTEPNLKYPLRRLIEQEGQMVLTLRNYPKIFTSTCLLHLVRQARLIKLRVKSYLSLVHGVIKQSLVLAKQVSYTKREFPASVIEDLDKDRKYTVVKTHVHESSFDEFNQFKDIYFGRLPQFLAQEKNVLSLAHIHGDHEEIMKKIRNSKNQALIPWEYFLTSWDILSTVLKFLFWRIRIESIYFDGLDVSYVIREEIKRTRFALNQTCDQYLFYDSVKHFVKAFKVEKFIYTYENISWERMAILALRKFSSETRIVGYQHSTVPQAETGVFANKDEISVGPLPDKILTVGEITSNIINRYSDFSNGLVEPSCALRYEYLFNYKSKERTRSNNILLVLEGQPAVLKMVNYVLGQLWESDSYYLTIRAHPILPFNWIRNRIDYKIEKSSRISASENDSVFDDLINSDIVIYWGSTVALEALSLGIPLIRYRMGNLLSYDPLFECDHLKWECSENNSLIDTIESIYQLSDEEFSNRAQEAKKYLDRYFHPVTDSNLNKFVCV